MKNSKARLAPRIWTVMLALSLVGQIAWAVENSWFNTFVFIRANKVCCYVVCHATQAFEKTSREKKAEATP